MNKPIYQTMKVVFAEPIRALNEMFSDTQSWGVSTLKEWIDGYESTRFTAIDGHTAIITSEYNMECVKEWLGKNTPTSINTQMDSLIPPSKISGLTQGIFVGSVSDNFDERIEQKIFHAEIVVDNEKVAAETKAYKPIPVITDFTDENGKDCMRDMIHSNYNRIKEEVKQIVKDELARIANDENLSHLLQKK